MAPCVIVGWPGQLGWSVHTPRTQDRGSQIVCISDANGDAEPGMYSTGALTELIGRRRVTGVKIRGVPLNLTDAELATAATACRALAYQEAERAKNMENPTTRGPIESAAQRYAALAAKLEAARRSGTK